MKRLIAFVLLAASAAMASAGPYSLGLNDPDDAHDAPVPGFVGPDGEGLVRVSDGQGGYVNPDNYVNPLFFGWATGWVNYLPSDTFGGGTWNNPTKALGPVTGDESDVVSRGDLSPNKLKAGNAAPGRITLTFTHPITDKPGADFVVFENAFIAYYSTSGARVGGVAVDLAYVEVSNDGTHFARFPSTSLTPAAVGIGSISREITFNEWQDLQGLTGARRGANADPDGDRVPDLLLARCRGFTLIELLVVIAIVGVVVAILLPVLASAKLSGQAAASTGNLRQLAAANLSNDGRVKIDPLFHDMITGAQRFENGTGGHNGWYIGGTPAAMYQPSRQASIFYPVQTVMFTTSAYANGSGVQEHPFCQPPYWPDQYGNPAGYRPSPTVHFRFRGQSLVAWCDGYVSAEKMQKRDDGDNPNGGDADAHNPGWFGPDDSNGFWNPAYDPAASASR